MDTTTTYPPGSITCAKPGCGNITTLAESVYVEGCGQVCPDCAGPLPALERHRAAVLDTRPALTPGQPPLAGGRAAGLCGFS